MGLKNTKTAVFIKIATLSVLENTCLVHFNLEGWDFSLAAASKGDWSGKQDYSQQGPVSQK